MQQALDYLGSHWLAGLLLAAALLGIVAALHRRRTGALPYVLASGALAAVGMGGMLLPRTWSFWLAAGAVALFFGMLTVLILSGRWSAWLGYLVGALLLLGAGGLGVGAAAIELTAFLHMLGTLEFAYLGWLLFLLFVPVIIWLSSQSLAGLGFVRRWLAIGLRCALVILLTFALSEVRASHHGETTTVLFVVDCSYSIPEGFHPLAEQFINALAEKRAPDRYQVGVVYFGARPRLVRSATDAPRINVRAPDAFGTIDRNYTDIGAALKLALASFPEGTSKRIVLLSDGNEDLGSAEEQARIARLNNVQIDVVPIGAGRRKENEVLVQSIDAPPAVKEGSPVPIEVTVRSFNPNLVVGTLTVKQRIDTGEWKDVDGSPRRGVELKQGANTFSFQHRPVGIESEAKQGAYTYVAEFIPEALKRPEDGKILAKGLPGDLKQNNVAVTHIVAHRKRRRVLLLEPTEGDFAFLEQNLPALRQAPVADRPYDLVRRPVASLPREELAALLSGFDCVILANLSSGTLDASQQEALRSNTHDQGCGLIMVGGPDSFGAGGWQGTKLEEALPVDTDIKSFKVQGKVGLVLIMHASEMAKGNYWQKQIAKLAIRTLSAVDEVGIVYYDGIAGAAWHFNLQPIGNNLESMLARVDSLAPGDMPDFDPSLKLAYDALTAKERELVGKHVILVSDGDPVQNDKQLLARMGRDKVTVTTVGVATHGAPQDQALANIAESTGGRYYNVTNPNALPSIYLKETRLISQDFLYQKPFQPSLPWAAGPAENLKAPLPRLTGFVRTTPKPKAVSVPIESPEIAGHRFPILAYWHYGLGKAVAFTSDAAPHDTTAGKVFWANDWSEAGIYGRFWEQMIDWALRPLESERLGMNLVTRDGKTSIIVTARDADGQPLNNLQLRGGVSSPPPAGEPAKSLPLKFVQTGVGVYEATFKTQEVGSYFINAQVPRRVRRPRTDEHGKPLVDKEGKTILDEAEDGLDSIRGAVTVPYSPEFADVESNPILLERLREATGGMTISEDRLLALYNAAVRAGRVPEQDPTTLPATTERGSFAELSTALANDVFRAGPPASKSLQPIWFWLVFLAGMFLLFDVAVRRIAVEPAKVAAVAQSAWSRLRGRAASVTAPAEFLERLRNRKAQVEESINQARTTRRFEPPQSVALPPLAGVAPPRPPAPRPPPPPTAEPSSDAADYADRLLRAKKRVWEEREKDKGSDAPS